LTRNIKNVFKYGRVDGATAPQPAPGRSLIQLITAGREFENTNEQDFYQLLDMLHDTLNSLDQMLFNMLQDLPEVITSHFAIRFSKDITQHTNDARGEEGSKEIKMMDVYFNKILPNVVRPSPDNPFNYKRIGLLTQPLSEAEAQRSAIWIMLMFRMWAWLILHDFNPLDRMIERTKYMNSRKHIFIA
jgi:hypothetical protein